MSPCLKSRFLSYRSWIWEELEFVEVAPSWSFSGLLFWYMVKVVWGSGWILVLSRWQEVSYSWFSLISHWNSKLKSVALLECAVVASIVAWLQSKHKQLLDWWTSVQVILQFFQFRRISYSLLHIVLRFVLMPKWWRIVVHVYALLFAYWQVEANGYSNQIDMWKYCICEL